MILQQIAGSFKALVGHPAFAAWSGGQSMKVGDLIVVNNSFLFRQNVKTNKSKFFPALELGAGVKPAGLPDIVVWQGMNSDHQVVAKQSSNFPHLMAIPDAVEEQLAAFGRLAFILVGQVQDDIVIQEPVNHSLVTTLELQPLATVKLRVEGKMIVVKDTFDEEHLWQELQRAVNGKAEDLESLRIPFGVALDALEERTYARLVLPQSGSSQQDSVLAGIATVLDEQKRAYDAALRACGGDPSTDRKAYNELLRIAYNFSSDAVGLLRLLISICDLKPIVFWGTVGEHYSLAQAFRALPWLRSRAKPSVSNYLNTIGDARNSAFHHLFPFRKTLQVPLVQGDLKAMTLRLFSEFGKAKENRLAYQDQEVVEVLAEFTRSRERRIASRFWRQNAEVMEATIALFRQTHVVLSAILEAS
jgi:hypothetical protein